MGIRWRHLVCGMVLGPFGLLALAGPAAAYPTLPTRKPGLWLTTMTMHMTMNGQPMNAPMGGPGGPGGMVVAMCLDTTTDMKMMEKTANMRGNACTKPDFEGADGSYTIAATCTSPNMGPMSMNGTIVYHGNAEVVVKTQMKSAAMNGTMTQDQKWSGACPAGMAPGDFGMMMNGRFQKMSNVNDGP